MANALSRFGAVLFVDADLHGSTLDWQEQRAADGAVLVIDLAKTRLYREIPVIGRHYDWVVLDGPPRVNDLAKSTIAAGDVILVPVQPSPFDVWAVHTFIRPGLIVVLCGVSYRYGSAQNPWLSTTWALHQDGADPGTSIHQRALRIPSRSEKSAPSKPRYRSG